MYYLTDRGIEALDLYREGVRDPLTEPEYSVLHRLEGGEADLRDLIVAARFYSALGLRTLGQRRSQPLDKALKTVLGLEARGLIREEANGQEG